MDIRTYIYRVRGGNNARISQREIWWTADQNISFSFFIVYLYLYQSFGKQIFIEICYATFCFEYAYLIFFFITITNRDITKQTDQYLSQKNQEFNDLNKAVMETLYFCFLRYFSERCRETIMLAIFLIMQSELNAIPS